MGRFALGCIPQCRYDHLPPTSRSSKQGYHCLGKAVYLLMKGTVASSWRHILPHYIVGGRKRRFGIAGILNILITNIILQLSLSAGMSIAISTLTSQIFNGLCGYFLYGTLVFRQGNSRTWVTPLRYGVMFMGLWFSNWAGISFLHNWVTSRNVAAILMIPLLAILSYITQKYWVFTSQ